MVFRKGVSKFLGIFLAVSIFLPGLFLTQEAAAMTYDHPATDVQRDYCFRLYKYGLGRPEANISTGEVYGWADNIPKKTLSPEDVARGIFLSPEGTNYSNRIPDAKFVSNLYQGILGRTEEPGGYKVNLAFLTNVKLEMINSLMNSAECTGIILHSTSAMKAANNAEFITGIYLEFFGRNPTTAEFNTQMGKLIKSREGLLNAFLFSAEYKSKLPAIKKRKQDLMVDEAIRISKLQTYYRLGSAAFPYFDCSGFVSYCLRFACVDNCFYGNSPYASFQLYKYYRDKNNGFTALNAYWKSSSTAKSNLINLEKANKLSPGDIIFWHKEALGNQGDAKFKGHVAIYIGDGKIVEICNKDGVETGDVWAKSDYYIIGYQHFQ